MKTSSIRAGDAVMCYRVVPDLKETKRRDRGVVLWTHPKGRFAVIVFAGGVRECFYPNEIAKM